MAFVLLESGGNFLLESGGKFLLESGPTPGDGALLLQNGFDLLLETGGRLLLEGAAPPPPPGDHFRLLLETGFSLLLESGAHLLIEHQTGPTPPTPGDGAGSMLVLGRRVKIKRLDEKKKPLTPDEEEELFVILTLVALSLPGRS